MDILPSVITADNIATYEADFRDLPPYTRNLAVVSIIEDVRKHSFTLIAMNM